VCIIGSWAILALLEPLGNSSVIFEGAVEVSSYLCLDQPVVDPLLCVVPLSPVLAQLPVVLLQVLLKFCLSQLVNVGFDPKVIEVM